MVIIEGHMYLSKPGKLQASLSTYALLLLQGIKGLDYLFTTEYPWYLYCKTIFVIWEREFQKEQKQTSAVVLSNICLTKFRKNPMKISAMESIFDTLPLCEKCVRFRSFPGLYFPAFGLNTERYGVSLRI